MPSTASHLASFAAFVAWRGTLLRLIPSHCMEGNGAWRVRGRARLKNWEGRWRPMFQHDNSNGYDPLTGAATGLVAALILARLMSSFRYGVHPSDPATFCAVLVVLAGVALLATYIPARRAIQGRSGRGAATRVKLRASTKEERCMGAAEDAARGCTACPKHVVGHELHTLRVN